MEISDRRYQELVASMANRHSRADHVPSPSPRKPARTQAAQIARQSVPTAIDHPPAHLVTRPVNLDRDVKEILFVDPDPGSLRAAQSALRLVADVETFGDFQAARARLLTRPPDLLVTNLRLQAYNGLHLVYLSAGTPTRCIAFADYHNLALAREVQAAGAFYERSNRLLQVLSAYVHALLPPRDRRSPSVLDRQQIVGGGRRCSDKFSGAVQFM